MNQDDATKTGSGTTPVKTEDRKPVETTEQRLQGEIELLKSKMANALAAIRADQISHAIDILS